MDKSGEEKTQIAASILSADFSRLGERSNKRILGFPQECHICNENQKPAARKRKLFSY